MLSRDEEVASELALEKTDEELAEVLGSYQSSWFSWWRVLWGVLVVVAVGLMVHSCVDKGKRVAPYIDTASMGMDLQSMFLIGMEIQESREGKALLLWKSDPSNKSYFMNYVVATGVDGELTMEGILEKAKRLDSENSFYDYYAATAHASKYDDVVCVREVESTADVSVSRKKLGDVKEWEVVNRPLYDKALAYIVEAGKKKGIISHYLEAHLDHLEELRRMKEAGKMDILGQYISANEYFSDVGFYSVRMLRLSNIFNTKFYELSQGGTREEVRFWIDEYLKLLDTMMGDRAVLIDLLVVKAMMGAPLGNMLAAAEQAGMKEEVVRISQLIDQLNEKKEQRDVESEARIRKKVGVADSSDEYSRDSFVMDLSKEPIMSHAYDKDAVMLPSPKEGRLADHAFLGRLFSFASVVIFLIVLVVMWIFFFAKHKEVRKLSMQALGALKLVDCMIVVVGGVFLPVLLYLIVNGWMALGLSVREWSVLSANSGLVLIQFLGMLMAVLTLSVALLRWRLSVRLPFLFSGASILGWVFPCLSISAMILVGLSDTKSAELPWILAGSFVSLAFLGWLVLGGIGACRKKGKLVSVTMCRGMLSVYGCLIIVFSGLNVYYEAKERYWISESEEMTFKAEYLGLMTVEFNVCVQVRKEIEERLDIIR